MSKHGDRDEWLRDINARQRNIVFPDTANNEGRFWRNVIDGHQRLNFVQKFGIFLIYSTLLVALATTEFRDFQSGFTLRSVTAGFIQMLIGFGILGVFLGLFSLSQWIGQIRGRLRRRRQ